MRRRRERLVWTITFGLVLAGVASVGALLATGAPVWPVVAGVLAIGYVDVQAWRSGGRFEADAYGGRPLTGRDPPEIRHALLDVCERAGRPIPDVMAIRMDVPGVIVGYSDGRPLVAIDPRLLSIVGPDGLRALFAHELGHLGTDLHTDVLRSHVPAIVGFGTFWVVFLSSQSAPVAILGSALYVGLALLHGPYTLAVRGVLSLGTEPLALAASRYANRQEELLADAYAAEIYSADQLVEALYRIAAVATGDNDEDVAGPVPWSADRSMLFSLLATHPSIEHRAEVLDCPLPEWVRPFQPHAESEQGRGDAGMS